MELSAAFAYTSNTFLYILEASGMVIIWLLLFCTVCVGFIRLFLGEGISSKYSISENYPPIVEYTLGIALPLITIVAVQFSAIEYRPYEYYQNQYYEKQLAKITKPTTIEFMGSIPLVAPELVVPELEEKDESSTVNQ